MDHLELIEALQKLPTDRKFKVAIPVEKADKPFFARATPHVEVAAAIPGIDWDNGILFLIPAQQLTTM